jgi:hypothetical protein
MLQSPLLKKYCGGPKKVSQGPAFKGANSKNSSCWKGYKKEGTKKSPSGTGETVNNCVKIGSK